LVFVAHINNNMACYELEYSTRSYCIERKIDIRSTAINKVISSPLIESNRHH